jgi:hypothetical protein
MCVPLISPFALAYAARRAQRIYQNALGCKRADTCVLDSVIYARHRLIAVLYRSVRVCKAMRSITGLLHQFIVGQPLLEESAAAPVSSPSSVTSLSIGVKHHAMVLGATIGAVLAASGERQATLCISPVLLQARVMLTRYKLHTELTSSDTMLLQNAETELGRTIEPHEQRRWLDFGYDAFTTWVSDRLRHVVIILTHLNALNGTGLGTGKLALQAELIQSIQTLGLLEECQQSPFAYQFRRMDVEALLSSVLDGDASVTTNPRFGLSVQLCGGPLHLPLEPKPQNDRRDRERLDPEPTPNHRTAAAAAITNAVQDAASTRAPTPPSTATSMPNSLQKILQSLTLPIIAPADGAPAPSVQTPIISSPSPTSSNSSTSMKRPREAQTPSERPPPPYRATDGDDDGDGDRAAMNADPRRRKR